MNDNTEQQVTTTKHQLGTVSNALLVDLSQLYEGSVLILTFDVELKHAFEWPTWKFPTHQPINTDNKGIIGKTMVIQV